jgi:hypothetical protein
MAGLIGIVQVVAVMVVQSDVSGVFTVLGGMFP